MFAYKVHAERRREAHDDTLSDVRQTRRERPHPLRRQIRSEERNRKHHREEVREQLSAGTKEPKSDPKSEKGQAEASREELGTRLWRCPLLSSGSRQVSGSFLGEDERS